MPSTDQRSIGTDRINSLLASSRRRHVISILSVNDDLPVEKLGRKVAALERNESFDAIDAEAHERVIVSLVHNHLPRLADHDVLEYDPERGDVAPGPSFDELARVFERFRDENDASNATLCSS